ncbi:MAG: tRNA lysidine(34) synthetase TilS, partial [Actinomycetota bacterium]
MSVDQDSARIVSRAVASSLVDLEPDALVLVAVSGGADSLALARGVAATGRPMAVGIVDHRLQVGSDAVAQRAAEQCTRMGIRDVSIQSVDVTETGQGPEAAARSARRTALEALADRLGAAAILLAHTRDDQAETVLMRLARGSGARSLAAMAPVAGRWRRPLLDVPRDVVRSSVADLEIWEDPHNLDPAYTRTRVRHDALPALVQALGPDSVSGLARSARLLRDDADALDAMAAEASSRLTGADASLDVDELARLPRALRTRVIRLALLAAGCPASALTSAHIDRVEALASDWHG